jgi:hypothetical protein
MAVLLGKAVLRIRVIITSPVSHYPHVYICWPQKVLFSFVLGGLHGVLAQFALCLCGILMGIVPTGRCSGIFASLPIRVCLGKPC